LTIICRRFGRYMNLSEKCNANFFLCNYNYNYSEVYVSLGYIFLTKSRLFFHKVCFIINTLSPPLCETCWLPKTLYWSVRALHTCVSAHCCPQNIVLGVQPWGGKRGGFWRVLNCDCMEDEGEKIQGLDFCRCSHGWHHLGQWRNLVGGILEEKCHNQFRVICADIKEVNSTNLKGLAKQED
jgi:hypothetical protein